MYLDGLLEVIRASTRQVRAVEDTQTVSNLPLSGKCVRMVETDKDDDPLQLVDVALLAQVVWASVRLVDQERRCGPSQSTRLYTSDFFEQGTDEVLVAAVAVEAAADDVADVELALEQSSAISVNHVETSAESPPWYRHTLTACWNSSEQAQVESVLRFGIGRGQG